MAECSPTDVEADFEPLPFYANAARAFGKWLRHFGARGARPPVYSYDAMIAATAIANG